MIDRILALGGITIIVLQVTIMAADPYEKTLAALRIQVAVVALGLALNQIGVWHLSSGLFSGRRYFGLRAEVDTFIKLVRQLNTNALDKNESDFEAVKDPSSFFIPTPPSRAEQRLISPGCRRLAP